jgi:transposase
MKLRRFWNPKQRKRKVSLQVILSGIIYLLENGCKWERLPPQYGNYKTVWYYYHKWMVFGVLEKLLFTLNEKVRVQQVGKADQRDPGDQWIVSRSAD